MHIIIIFLLLVIILLIGGPMALGLTVAVPAFVVGTGLSVILPFAFWGLVVIAGMVAAMLIVSAIDDRPKKRACPTCQNRQTLHYRYCQNCMHDFGDSIPVKLPESPPSL